MSEPRVLLMIGNQRRHRYVASQLAEHPQLIGIVTESKAQVIRSEPRAIEESLLESEFSGEEKRDGLKTKNISTTTRLTYIPIFSFRLNDFIPIVRNYVVINYDY